MSNYISESLSEDKKSKENKKLTHEFLCKVAKAHLQNIYIVLPSVFAVFGAIFVIVLFLCIISPLDVFVTASIAVLILAITIALIYRSLSKDYIAAYQTIINKKYTIITDTVYTFSERTVFEFSKYSSIRIQPIMIFAICDPIDVHASDMEEIKTGDTFYIVVSNEKPKKALFLFDINQYELDESEM